MPIQLNLKEIFTTDAQSELAAKINFNFGKLIELGIGEEGPQGDLGPQGPAGPAGPAGPRGPRGATIYTGSGTNLATSALTDDLFITTGGVFFKKTSTGWSQFLKISDFFQGDSLFFREKMFDILPTDTTYTPDVKNKNSAIIRLYKNSSSDVNTVSVDGVNYGSKIGEYPRNSTFFLNNFDLDVWKNTYVTGNQNSTIESILNTIGKAITTIYSNFLGSTSGTATGRSQIQLGALYKKTSNTTAHTFSVEENNLKIKHFPIKPTSDPLYFLSEFDSGGTSSITSDSANSAFRFKTDFLESISGFNSSQPFKGGVNIYTGGAIVIKDFTQNSIYENSSGLLVQKTLPGSIFNGVIGISNSFNTSTNELIGNFNILTKENLNLASAKTITIRSFDGQVTNNVKGVILQKIGTISGSLSNKTTGVGIGGSPNASLTVFGAKNFDQTAPTNSTHDSDQVNIGAMTGRSITNISPRRVGTVFPAIAKEISSYIGFNLYYNELNPQILVKHRADPNSTIDGDPAAPGVGSGFVMTRDGSMHYICFAKDPDVIADIPAFVI